MRLLAYGPLMGMTVVLAADSTPVFTMPPDVLQGGILAVLAWTIYYVLVKVFPAHERAQKDQRDAFLEFIDKRRDIRDD